MTALDDLKGFDVDGAEVTLWTYKKQSPKGSAPLFNGHWVDTTDDMDLELKSIVNQQISAIEEQLEYGLLAQNHESSVLHITLEETYAPLVIEEFSAEQRRRKVKDVKTLLNCAFYIIKCVKDGSVLYCCKKTDPSWRTQVAKNFVAVVFNEKQLEVINQDSFNIHRSIDFFGIGQSILVKDKRNFESILNYKDAHEKDYDGLCQEIEFQQIFSDLAEITNFVGSNKIQLRRMSAIRQKGFYRNEIFMDNLREKYQQYNLNLNFDGNGRLVPSPETCRDIVSALLDHRLGSGFSGNIYDVPDVIQV
ncbi:DUF4868 domain-containing protein [Sinorhizobium medicae]|nr:DUF4868 domain-containing protein [Sinorhizobium medicae]